MNVEYIVGEQDRVFRKTTYVDGGIIEIYLGMTIKFTIVGDQIYYEKFAVDHYELKETTEVPKTVEDKIDYEAINVRLEYWQSEGSAT
ncbi:hypothetical protein [Cohnella phaseoli]|uniref:Uncharacterized protein n=1 Tax=Cohnella phaseoli TaxID=456490 RepID=A0A3D9KKW3_9BACL|nr:hypothetical protein [Cohnella phaseoli]RED86223.1 hypothetical protein DFP98_10375 [Cohnella phaseoli]